MRHGARDLGRHPTAGFVPLETHFEHVFHNPVNQFDSSMRLRGCRAEVSSLVGLLQNCGAFVGVVSGLSRRALGAAARAHSAPREVVQAWLVHQVADRDR
jgi:hypothetical protein